MALVRSSWVVGLAAAALLATSGCGDGRPATYPVSGTVRFEDGEPVRFGSVEFRDSQRHTIARGQLDPQGRFSLATFAANDGATEGRHRVVVVQLFRPDQPLAPPEGVYERPGEHAHHRALQGMVDPAFASYETSPLTADVRAKTNNEIALSVRRMKMSPRDGGHSAALGAHR